MKRATRFNSAMFRAVREARGLSLRTFSAPLGVSKDATYRIEHGHGFPSIGLLHRLADVYGVDLRTLFS